MGPQSFDECRESWEKEGIYPPGTQESSHASCTTEISTLRRRGLDWWASLHRWDKKEKKWVIDKEETKKAADAHVRKLRKSLLLFNQK